MSDLYICPDGTLGARRTGRTQEFNYEAFNAHQAALADQQEHYREVRERKAKREAATKRNTVRKLNKEYDDLMTQWANQKTFEVFCRIEEIEETLVKILG